MYLLIALAAAVVTLGARWSMIERDGSPIPYLDQWFGEGIVIYRPAVWGTMSVEQLWMPHNGHRLVPSRLLAWGLFELNQQWDVRLQLLVNAILAAALCFPLLALVRPWFHPALHTVVAALLAWFFAEPILYENALWGFQSCFYLLVLLSLTQIRLMLGHDALSAPWWAGVAVGLVTLVTMGSGLLSSAIVAGIAGLGVIRARAEGSSRVTLLTPIAGVALCVLGAWSLPSDAIGQNALAHGKDFFRTLWHSLAFPGRDYSHAGLLVWAPFMLLALSAFSRRRPDPAWTIAFATGGWVLLQIAAMGYAREHTGDVLSNRYYEILTVGMVVNFAAWGWLWQRCEITGRSVFLKTLFVAAAMGWTGFVGWQAAGTARVHRNRIEPMYQALRPEQVKLVREFLHTGDARAIEQADAGRLPFPKASDLIAFLRVPEIAAVMPFEVRTPVVLNFSAADGGATLNNALPISLPHEMGMMHRGTFLPGAGAAATVNAISAAAPKASASHLVFKVAGDLIAGETELRVRGERGETVAVITDVHSDRFVPVEISAPGNTFTVEVIDRSPTRWLAFVGPAEIGPLSRLTRFALRHAAPVTYAGVGGLLLLFAWSAWELGRRHEPAK